ncbi:MAG: HlyC/CorC family transporter [Acidobacteria bacterium]|nr:HlyC/CorC family transporter [Acidobacteriota bacterium]
MDDPASLLLFLAETTSAVPFDAASTAWNLLLVAVLVAANGFFVASEFALVAVRRSRVEAAAAEGDQAAQKLLEMLKNINGYISATQLGITLFSLALGWFGEPAVAAFIQPIFLWLAEQSGLAVIASSVVLHTFSLVISFSLVTFFLIVFGELAPKTIALEKTEKIAYLTAPVLRLFYRIFIYPIRLLEWSGKQTVRLLGLGKLNTDQIGYTEEEIKQLLSASLASGHLNEEEHKLIDQIFAFSDTTVKEAMIPRTEIVAISVKSTLEDILDKFAASGYSRLPVYRGSLDDIAGYIHSKDVVAFLRNAKSFKIEKLMKKPHYVVDTARLEDVLRQMQEEKFHFGFVVDEHGGVEGIITLEDLLEEIVGDISDEHDEEVNEQIDEQKDGSYILDGGLAVRDLNKRLGLSIPISEAYTTIAGFLMSEAGRILDEGEAVPFNGHTFHIETVDRRRIKKVRLQKN